MTQMQKSPRPLQPHTPAASSRVAAWANPGAPSLSETLQKCFRLSRRGAPQWLGWLGRSGRYREAGDPDSARRDGPPRPTLDSRHTHPNLVLRPLLLHNRPPSRCSVDCSQSAPLLACLRLHSPSRRKEAGLSFGHFCPSILSSPGPSRRVVRCQRQHADASGEAHSLQRAPARRPRLLGLGCKTCAAAAFDRSTKAVCRRPHFLGREVAPGMAGVRLRHQRHEEQPKQRAAQDPLRPAHVPLSLGQSAPGSPSGLHHCRRGRPLSPLEGRARAAAHGLGRLRLARGECCHGKGNRPWPVDQEQHSHDEGTAGVHEWELGLGQRRSWPPRASLPPPRKAVPVVLTELVPRNSRPANPISTSTRKRSSSRCTSAALRTRMRPRSTTTRSTRPFWPTSRSMPAASPGGREQRWRSES